MKKILIITTDVIKIKQLTGVIGKTYSAVYLFLFKLILKITIWFYRRSFQVSVLALDCSKIKQVNVFYYSHELTHLNLAENRRQYLKATDKILKEIQQKQESFFQESGINITQLFKTRLAHFLADRYLVDSQVCRQVISQIKPDKIIYLNLFGLNRINDKLFKFLLTREYRKKLNMFICQSQVPLPALAVYHQASLLSLDFYRHLKSFKPIYQKLAAEKYNPLIITDITNPDAKLHNIDLPANYLFLASFLPEARQLAKIYNYQLKKILVSFHHPSRPLIFYSLILSKLYLKAGEKLFKELDPKNVIVVSDLRFLETGLAALAKKSRTFSLMISPNTLLDSTQINPYDTTDKITLPGDFVKNQLIKIGLPEKKLTVVGDLQLESKPKFTKRQVYKTLGVDNLDKKIVLLISFRPNSMIPTEEKKLFVQWCSAAVRQVKAVILVIKPHPTEKRSTLVKELESYGVKNVVVADNQKLELADLLSASAVVLQTWSMTLFEAVAMNRPVISVNPLSKDYNFFLPVINTGGAVEVTTQAALVKYLQIFQDHHNPRTQNQLNRANRAVKHFINSGNVRASDKVFALLRKKT